MIEGVAFRKGGAKEKNVQERRDSDTVGGGWAWVGGWGRDKEGSLVWGRWVNSTRASNEGHEIWS